MRTVKLGVLRHVDTPITFMPRAAFIEIVEREVAAVDISDELAAALLATARSMPAFPLNAWIHSERGCGCVVGEYLIAADIVDRATPNDTVDDMLDGLPYGNGLRDIGCEVDRQVRDHVRGELFMFRPLAVVLVEYGEDEDAALARLIVAGLVEA